MNYYSDKFTIKFTDWRDNNDSFNYAWTKTFAQWDKVCNYKTTACEGSKKLTLFENFQVQTFSFLFIVKYFL